MLDAFSRMVGDAKTVVYGEDSHGMQRIHELVPQLFRTLVERKGYRVFVFEVQWGVTDGLADFMASDRTELGSTESYWLNGAFASKPVAAMLVWIRDWNRRNPGDPILIAGYQPEQPVTDFAALLAFVDKALPADSARLRKGIASCRAADTATYKTELDFILANSKFNREGKPAFTEAERAECLAGLAAIEAAMAPFKADMSTEARMARLHLFSVTSYFGIQRKLIDTYFASPDASVATQRSWSAETYGRGDAARYHVYRELQAMRFPKSKVFHWMHNWHAFRHASETDGLDGPGGAGIPRGTRSFGELLAADERGAARTFITVVPCGKTCSEPAKSIEPAYAALFGDRSAIVSTTDKRSRESLGFDRSGSMWANQHKMGFADVVAARQADSVIYIPSSETVRN